MMQEYKWFHKDKTIWHEIKKDFKDMLSELDFKYVGTIKKPQFMVEYESTTHDALIKILWEKNGLNIILRLYNTKKNQEKKNDTFISDFSGFLTVFDFEAT